MPRVREKEYKEVEYSTDGCDRCVEYECINKPLGFECFDPIYAPVFVDMFITGERVRRNEIVKNAVKEGPYFYIFLKHPMEINTVFQSVKGQREYVLKEFKGVDRDRAFKYRVGTLSPYSVTDLDRNNLRKGLTIIRKGSVNE